MFVFGSDAFVHNSQFLNNRTNLPMHRSTSSGGGLGVVTDVGAPDQSRLRVSNTRFEGNQAGFVGGGLYSLGRWVDPVSSPRTVVLVANSTFENNLAIRDVFLPAALPTEGGGLHAEDQVTAIEEFYAEVGDFNRCLDYVHDARSLHLPGEHTTAENRLRDENSRAKKKAKNVLEKKAATLAAIEKGGLSSFSTPRRRVP